MQNEKIPPLRIQLNHTIIQRLGTSRLRELLLKRIDILPCRLNKIRAIALRSPLMTGDNNMRVKRLNAIDSIEPLPAPGGGISFAKVLVAVAVDNVTRDDEVDARTVQEAGELVVGVADLDAAEDFAVDEEFAGRGECVRKGTRTVHLVREHGRPDVLVDGGVELFYAGDYVCGGDEFNAGEVLLQHRHAREVVWVGVRCVNVDELLVGDGLFDPFCECLALLDGRGRVDERCGRGPVDEDAANW